jgi:signal transduction histidine kinase
MAATEDRDPDATTDRLDRLEEDANRLDLVSRWADDLAHEIKNPLHAMVINLELVKRRAGGGTPESLIERAEVVESELHRVHDLVDSLLRLVRPWPDTRTADVDGVFEALLPVLGARTRIRRLEFHHEPGGGIVAMPPGDLAQVLLNLMDNAIELSPGSGRIRTTCDDGDDGVVITISDDGPGIPEVLRGVLDPDAVPDLHRREGRAGRGLGVTVRIVDRAGGRLEMLDDEDGTGSTARLTLPRSTSA